MILSLAERDPALLDRLDLAASAAVGDPAKLGARLREALRRALRTGGGRFIEYGEAGGWAQGVLDLLDQVEALIGAGHARLALELLDELFSRIGRALENVDDSDGGGTEILERAAEIHLAACRAARPEPVALARDLFARETGDDFGTFDGASDTYVELLGPEGLAAYRRLAQAAWEKLPQGRRILRGGLVAMDEAGVARRALFRILDRFAEREGDLDRRIALRAADLTHAHDHLRLAQLCLTHGRESEALRWAEEGAWLFDDPSGEPLLLFLAERYLAAGRRAEAEAALRRGFERRPSAELYKALTRARGGKPGAPGRAGLADRAVALIEARIAAARGPAAAWARGGLVALLLEILALEQRLPAAWAAVRAHGCPDHALLRLAEASEATMPEEAMGAYAAMVERQVGLTNRQGYAEACRLVARIGALRGRRGEGAAAQRSFVEDLLRRHAAKRGFVAMLREATGATPPAPGGKAPAQGGSARQRR